MSIQKRDRSHCTSTSANECSHNESNVRKIPNSTKAPPTTAPITTSTPRPAPDVWAGVVVAVDVTTAGRSAAAAVGWVSTCPVSTITIVPLLGIPFTTTNNSAGPGINTFAFGGTCDTCRTYDPSSLTVYVLLNYRCR